MSQNSLLILAGIVLIMLILYGFLLFVVRWAERVIADQRQTILERSQTLEILSARMLHAEEDERRRVAWELHEEIAQTLSAVKIKMEALAEAAGQLQSMSGAYDSRRILPLLQFAIADVRALAMDLRPPELDDFGLVATTRSLCREAGQVHGKPGVTADITLGEDDIPDGLKSIIFRITQQTLKRLTETPGVSDIRVGLRRDQGLQLVVDFRVEESEQQNDDGPRFSIGERPLTDFWERAVLAGASFSTTFTDAGRLRYQAIWIV
jgi:signal transduction histidine kinase